MISYFKNKALKKAELEKTITSFYERANKVWTIYKDCSKHQHENMLQSLNDLIPENKKTKTAKVEIKESRFKAQKISEKKALVFKDKINEVNITVSITSAREPLAEKHVCKVTIQTVSQNGTKESVYSAKDFETLDQLEFLRNEIDKAYEAIMETKEASVTEHEEMISLLNIKNQESKEAQNLEKVLAAVPEESREALKETILKLKEKKIQLEEKVKK